MISGSAVKDIVYVIKQVLDGAAGVALVAAVSEVSTASPWRLAQSWSFGLLDRAPAVRRAMLPAPLGVLGAFVVDRWGSLAW